MVDGNGRWYMVLGSLVVVSQFSKLNRAQLEAQLGAQRTSKQVNTAQSEVKLAQCSSAQLSSKQVNTAQQEFKLVQYVSMQLNAIQHSSTQLNTAQYSTIQLEKVLNTLMFWTVRALR